MLETDSLAYMDDGIFPDSKTYGNCSQGNMSESIVKILSEDDVMLGSTFVGTNTGLYHLLCADDSPTNGDFDIFGDEWADINYMEGFDGLFRNCDSSFGQETVANNDQVSWFSPSSHTNEGYGNASQPAFKSLSSESSALKNTLKHNETNVYNIPCSAVTESDERSVPSSYSTLHHPSYVNCLDANAETLFEQMSEKQAFKVNGEIEDELCPVIMTIGEGSEMHGTVRRMQIKNNIQTEAERKNQYSECLSGDSNLNPGAPQQFENPTKRSSDSSPTVAALTSEKNVEKLHWKHHMQSQHDDMMNHAAVTGQDQLYQTEGGAEGQCIAEKYCTELQDFDADSSAVHESSGPSSVGSGKIYVDESGFHQLQYIMEQLDVRAKFCIRDSLYRLAWSAEQRNNMGHSRSSSRNERLSGGVMASGESNKCSGFMGFETDTNAIDRSMAHLLFHKPTAGRSFECHANTSFYTFEHDPYFMFY